MPDKAGIVGLAGSQFQEKPLAGPSTEGHIGSWRGESVRLEIPKSGTLLEHAKEELTFAHSEGMESKTIEERQVVERKLPRRLSEIQEIDAYLERLPHFNRAELQGLLRDLRANDPDTDGISRRVGRQFGDPSHAYAALDLAGQELRRDGLTDLADRVDAVKNQLMAEQGPAIRAGLNVSAAANEMSAGDRQTASELRDYYRTTVFGTPGPAAVYREILNQYGVEGFALRIAFLTRALGDDLGSTGPSVEPSRLRALLDGLSALRVLDTVHERCGQTVARLLRQGEVVVTATAVMQQLLALTEEVVLGPSKVNPIPDRLGIPADRLDMQIACFRESRELLAMMPVGVYRDLDARSAALRAVQEAMDIRIEREDNP